jgi:hypothetical protein
VRWKVVFYCQAHGFADGNLRARAEADVSVAVAPEAYLAPALLAKPDLRTLYCDRNTHMMLLNPDTTTFSGEELGRLTELPAFSVARYRPPAQGRRERLSGVDQYGPGRCARCWSVYNGDLE